MEKGAFKELYSRSDFITYILGRDANKDYLKLNDKEAYFIFKRTTAV